MNKFKTAFLLIMACVAYGQGQPAEMLNLPRVIVTTDGELDDRSSMIRFLLYCNEFDVQGIVPTNSKWQKHGHGTDWILEEIEAYEQVRANLLLHAKGYPPAEFLRKLLVTGNEDVSRLNRVGPDCDTPGSDHIIQRLLAEDERPLWILAWGGTNTIAQALWRLRESHPEKLVQSAFKKIRIYAIADQDSTIFWIRDSAPEVFLLLDYQFVVINYQHAGHPFSDADFFSEAWMQQNVKTGHGPLGALYPQTYQSEGDTPSFLHLIPNGLRSREHPAWGGWGGRHRLKSNNFWVDAADDSDYRKPQWRFLPAVSNDFAARMDWCVKPNSEANHPPLVAVGPARELAAKSGEQLKFDGSGSYDPDHDSLKFSWWQYREAGGFTGQVEIVNSGGSECTVAIPTVQRTETIHIILEVTDTGSPPLTRYQRIIIRVKPN